MAIVFPASSSSPYTDGNGVVWTWNGSAWGKTPAVAVDTITATGTPDATTYLRGDGTWSTPAGGGAATEVTALRPYTAGLARVASNTGSCDVLVIGTSISESGSNGTDSTSIPYTYRWQDRFRDIMRHRIGQTPTGGVGYKPFAWASAAVTPAPYTATSGTWGGDPYGLGLRNGYTTTAATRTYTETCTGFDIFFTGFSGAGTMYYTVDGGAPVTFSTANATVRAGMRQQVTGLSDASHTIVIGRDSGAGVYLEGIMVYRGDETVGFRVWDGSRSASTTATFSTSDNWQKAATTIQPDLVVIEQGINDVLAGYSPATFRTNLETIISKVRAETTLDPTIVVMSVWAKNTDPEGTQLPYRVAAQELADDDASVLFFDGATCTYTSETEANTNALGFCDGFHGSEIGSAALAIGLANFLDASNVAT